MNPLVIKYGAYALVVLGIFGAGYYKGYAPEHDKLVAYKATVVAKGEAQNAAAAAKDKLIKEQANESQASTTDAINSIYAYYNAHPVIRLRDSNTCSGKLPQADSGAKGSDGSSTSGYIGPYSPELTELIANQLNQLQQLLLKDGVKVE